MVLRPLYIFLNSFNAGILYFIFILYFTLQNLTYRRQILTYKDGPRAERVMQI